jgi:hypothetical protein
MHKGVKYKPGTFYDIRALSFLGFTFNLPYAPLEQAGTIDAMHCSWFAFGRLGG